MVNKIVTPGFLESSVWQDTVKQFQVSSPQKFIVKADSGLSHKPSFQKSSLSTEVADTATLCSRNSVADITFYDSTNAVRRIDPSILQDFPYTFTAINRAATVQSRAELVNHLKNGEPLPSNIFSYDWILPVIITSVVIYEIIFSELAGFFRGILKFISFRGINESTSRDINAIFQFQSTLFNLATFINISLFGFLSLVWYGFDVFGEKRFLLWLFSFGVIISAVTTRHLICIIVGNISGEKELFREYLIGIYQSYRLGALLLLLTSSLILYTTVFPEKFLFYAGFSIIALLYFIRLFRLFLVFINRHVSIFYLILYLCALEILPVAIIVKYVTGLV